MDTLADHYKDQADKHFKKVCQYAQFMGGLDWILNTCDKSPKEKVKLAQDLLKEFGEKE